MVHTEQRIEKWQHDTVASTGRHRGNLESTSSARVFYLPFYFHFIILAAKQSVGIRGSDYITFSPLTDALDTKTEGGEIL